jgi:hypothetical protein
MGWTLDRGSLKGDLRSAELEGACRALAWGIDQPLNLYPGMALQPASDNRSGLAIDQVEQNTSVKSGELIAVYNPERHNYRCSQPMNS